MGTDKTALEEVVRGGTTGSGVTGSDRKYALRMPGFFPRFFLTTAIVQVTWLPEVTEGHLTHSVFLWVIACATESCAISALWNGVRMCKRKLRNICPSVAF